MVRWLLLVLALIPGASPFLLGSELLGALLLVLGLNAWNLAFLGYFVLIADNAMALGHLGLTLGLLATVGSVVWTAVITSPSRRARLKKIADRAYEVGLHAFLRGKAEAARSAVEAGLRTSRQDCDLLFLAWRIARQQRDGAKARRLLRRLKRADVDEKWVWEIERAEEVVFG